VFVLLVIVAVVFWGSVFIAFLKSAGTTPSEFVFGRYEPPPADLGLWKEIPSEPGLICEERCLLPEGQSAPYLLLQRRYRDAATREILRIDPEERIARRRVSLRT